MSLSAFERNDVSWADRFHFRASFRDKDLCGWTRSDESQFRVMHQKARTTFRKSKTQLITPPFAFCLLPIPMAAITVHSRLLFKYPCLKEVAEDLLTKYA